MTMDFKANILIAVVFALLLGLSVWLQYGLLTEPRSEISPAEKNHPDYYVEKLVSYGMDESGKKYRIIADRMVHYPLGDRALLDNPHIIQYDLNHTPRHVYAESGLLYDNRSTVLLTGNVKVIQTRVNASGASTREHVATSQKMLIRLRDKNSS